MILIVARLLLYSVFAPCLAYGCDTLVVNQSLSGNQTLVSRAETFEMGFFRPGKSPNYYIGIWYNKARVVSETIVWVANRESPVSDKFSCKLKIRDGNLVLLNESNTLVWSTNITNVTATISASLVLLDNGNLVLSYGSNSCQPIWQSFDHPTHTFLPGGKLGYNKRKNTSQVLTSWRSREDPGPGLYSLQIDSIERQYVLKWNKSVQYWTSGSWDGQKHIFALVPEMGKNYIYNFSYVDNDNESYFTYSMYNREIISRLIIDISGQIKQLSWMDASQKWVFFWSQPQHVCEVYAACGTFGVCSENRLPFCSCMTAFEPTSQHDWDLSDYSGGCMRKTKLSCSAKEEKPGFILSYVPSGFLSSYPESETLLSDESACRSFCLAACSCYAYTFVSKQCLHWKYENLSNVSLMFVSSDSNFQTSAISIKVSSSDTPTQCGIYGFCGAFSTCNQKRLPFCSCLTGFQPRSENDWKQSKFSAGCVRNTALECGKNIEKNEFFMITVTSLSANSSKAVGSAGACHTTCANNCSCNAYSFVDNQCLLWEGDLLNLLEDEVNGKTIYIKVASKDLQRYEKNNRFPVGTVASIVGGVFILGLVVLIVYRKKRMLVRKTTMKGLLAAFVYRDLQIATKNFSNKLGEGGFGSVFKGVLSDSSIVAVKRLERLGQGEKQFRSEVSTIGTIQHVNLVRLHGFCAEGKNKLLVYDYMPNGSLHSHLFHEKQDNVLNWKTRYRIALGIAKGLVYLHEKCRECIIHCDIKPENILLDADFCPKIADFGLAKLVGRDFSCVLTTMRGTRGYLAPEWLSGVPITAKADVYSYGMMLFELVHGKRNAEQSEDLSFTLFPSVAANVVMVEGGDILSLLDSRLNREANVEEVMRICKVAYWCIQDEEENRPSMSLVEQMLEGISDVKMPPIPESVQFFADDTQHLVFSNESSRTWKSQEQNNSSSVNSWSKTSSR